MLLINLSNFKLINIRLDISIWDWRENVGCCCCIAYIRARYHRMFNRHPPLPLHHSHLNAISQMDVLGWLPPIPCQWGIRFRFNFGMRFIEWSKIGCLQSMGKDDWVTGMGRVTYLCCLSNHIREWLDIVTSYLWRHKVGPANSNNQWI